MKARIIWLSLVFAAFPPLGCFKKADNVRFAHITDPHLYDKLGSKNVPFPQEDEGCLNFAMLRSTIDKINSEHAQNPFAFVMLSGDIGIEKLLERALDKKCDQVTLTRNEAGQVLFDGENVDEAIRTHLKIGAQEFAEAIKKSAVKTWVFVNGNNDLCNEDVMSIGYFNIYLDELQTALVKSDISIRNLIGDGDYVSTFSHRKDTQHVFIGFENGSFKNNLSAEYAQVRNYKFQRDILNSLRDEVSKQESLGKNIHLLFHIPHFDDPFNAPTAKGPCDKRKPTTAVFADNCTQIIPKISGNAKTNLYSAWLVTDDLRNMWEDLINRASVKNLFAGHFHVAKRSYYEDLDIWQTQVYPNILKYDVSSPLAIKNQIFSDDVDQSRGFSAVDIDSSGSKTVLQFATDQRQYYKCPNDIQITPWETSR